MNKNFRVRLIVGFSMFFVALVALYTFDAIPFKILYCLFALVAGIELTSFFWRNHNSCNIILALFEYVFLIGSSAFVWFINPVQFWYIIFGVCGYDIFAYLLGTAFGGKIFGKARPFPKISKNKTWEGTLFGLIISTLLCVILMAIRGEFATEWMFLCSGIFALIGDLYESYLKRKFNIKDSNEIVIKNIFFKKLEIVVGGSDGHGGFLDRIDSIAFSATLFLIIMLIRMSV